MMFFTTRVVFIVDVLFCDIEVGSQQPSPWRGLASRSISTEAVWGAQISDCSKGNVSFSKIVVYSRSFTRIFHLCVSIYHSSLHLCCSSCFFVVAVLHFTCECVSHECDTMTQLLYLNCISSFLVCSFRAVSHHLPLIYLRHRSHYCVSASLMFFV